VLFDWDAEGWQKLRPESRYHTGAGGNTHGMSDRSQPTRTSEERGLLPVSELNALIEDPNTPQDIRERLIAQRDERGLAPMRETAEVMESALAEPAKPEPRAAPRTPLERIRAFFRIR
jgi:hypothetical protein